MELASIQTPAAAFLAGVVTSLHCAGMCGPLACMLAPARDDAVDPQTVATVYQVSRVGGYMALGAIAGGLGGLPGAWFGQGFLLVLPWALVAFFILVALRADKRLPRLAVLNRLQWRLQAHLRGRSRLRVAAMMGLATPVLPCGPLYFLIALAGFSGSALRGAEFMLAFGLGTAPLLWFTQANYGWLRVRLSPTMLARVQTVLAVASALVITWRLRGSLGFEGPDASSFVCF